MILCEYILIGAISVSVVTITGLIFGYYHSIISLVAQIKKLEDKIHELNDRLAQIQLKVLDVYEASGLN